MVYKILLLLNLVAVGIPELIRSITHEFQSGFIVVCENSNCPPLSNEGYLVTSPLRSLNRTVQFNQQFESIPEVEVYLLSYTESQPKVSVFCDVLNITTSQFTFSVSQLKENRLIALSIGWVASANPDVSIIGKQIEQLKPGDDNQIFYGKKFKSMFPNIICLISSLTSSGNFSFILRDYKKTLEDFHLTITDQEQNLQALKVAIILISKESNEQLRSRITLTTKEFHYEKGQQLNDINFQAIDSNIVVAIQQLLSTAPDFNFYLQIPSFNQASYQYESKLILNSATKIISLSMSMISIFSVQCTNENTFLQFVANDNNCLDCHSLCKQCIGSLQNECISCYLEQNRVFFLNQCICGTSYFENSTNKCPSCHFTCKHCTDGLEQSCTECYSNRFLELGKQVGECLCKNNTQNCNLKCNYTCLTCSLQNPFQCLSCDTSRELVDNQCLCLALSEENSDGLCIKSQIQTLNISITTNYKLNLKSIELIFNFSHILKRKLIKNISELVILDFRGNGNQILINTQNFTKTKLFIEQPYILNDSIYFNLISEVFQENVEIQATLLINQINKLDLDYLFTTNVTKFNFSAQYLFPYDYQQRKNKINEMILSTFRSLQSTNIHLKEFISYLAPILSNILQPIALIGQTQYLKPEFSYLMEAQFSSLIFAKQIPSWEDNIINTFNNSENIDVFDSSLDFISSCKDHEEILQIFSPIFVLANLLQIIFLVIFALIWGILRKMESSVVENLPNLNYANLEVYNCIHQEGHQIEVLRYRIFYWNYIRTCSLQNTQRVKNVILLFLEYQFLSISINIIMQFKNPCFQNTWTQFLTILSYVIIICIFLFYSYQIRELFHYQAMASQTRLIKDELIKCSQQELL